MIGIGKILLLFLVLGRFSDSSVIIVEDAKACYRRVLAGKRVVDKVILRLIPCERLEDCQRECAEERRFDCETFNYRLDPSNRGKGICELSATPVALLDLRKDFIADRDYDFYELDRNSAPDCSLTWPDYTTSYHEHHKPQWRPSYSGGGGESGGWNKGWDTHRRDDSWRDRSQERNRWDRNFVPYEIAGGLKDSAWGRYGGTYGSGGSKYHNQKSSYDFWGLEEDKHYQPNSSYFPVKGVYHYSDFRDGRKPYSHGFNYFDLGHKDAWSSSSYGKKYGYSGSSWGGHRSDSFGQEEWTGTYSDFKPFDCSSRSGSGFRISPHLIRKSVSVPQIYDCERECYWESRFQCNSFSYRYSQGPSDNCYLSTRPYQSLDLYNDVQPDRDFDMYSMNPDRRHCSHVHPGTPPLHPGPGSSGPPPFHPPHHHVPHYDPHHAERRPWEDRRDSDCFWRVRSGKRISQHAVKLSFVARGIAHCEEECIKLNTFTCRAFSFRHGPPVIGEPEENCHLTDIPLAGLSGHGLSPAPSCELYERGSYGKGCEKNPFSLDTPSSHHHNHLGHGHRMKPIESCYLQYDTSAKLLPDAVRIGARVRTEEDCKRQCASLRGPRGLAPPPPVPPHFRCMSFSFTSDSSLPPSKDNCLLSDIQLRDLEPGLDYTPSKTHWLFSYNTFDPECSTNEVGFPIEPPKRPIPPPHFPIIPSSEEDDEDDYRNYPPPPSSHGHGHVHHGPPPGHGGPPSGHGGPPSGHGEPPGHGFDSDRRYDDDLGLDTWSYFTVSGWPCRRGTKCAPNSIASYWSCELEGGEVGSWDYCCHPSHKCGHSRGFDQPWCYVGPDRDQWRPCSDRYYPYAPMSTGSSSGSSHRPWSPYKPSGYHPEGDHNDLPPFGKPYSPDADRRYWDGLYKDGPQAYYDHHGNPKPGYVRVPTVERNPIKYNHNHGPDGPPHNPHWVPVRLPEDDHHGPSFLAPPRPGGFGIARYWPVSYLHKDDPPNSTYYKSDKETGRPNNIPRPNFDKPTTPKLDRRNDDTKNTNRRDDPVTQRTQILSVGSLETERSNEKTTENIKPPSTTEKSRLTSESLTLKSSSKYDDEGEVKGDDSEDTLDGKLEKFGGDHAELISSSRDTGSRLERLKKEEKQIEEIGKVFASIRDRGVDTETRSFRADEDDKTKFESIFVPISLEKKEKSQKFIQAPQGFSLRSFSARSLDRNEQDSVQKIDNKPEKLRNFVTPSPAPVSAPAPAPVSSRNFSTIPAIIGFLPADSNRWRFTEDISTSTSLSATTANFSKKKNEQPKATKAPEVEKPKQAKSLVSNGQVFYEVPRDEPDGKKMAHIEKVELPDRSVTVKIANEETNETFEPVKIEKTTHAPTKLPSEDFSKFTIMRNTPKVEEQHTFTKHLTSSITSTTEKQKQEPQQQQQQQQQFGARTMGKIRKVELPIKSSSLRLVRRGRRNFRLRYDPNEVRKRLLEKKKIESEERIY